jgi:hypothetical protein
MSELYEIAGWGVGEFMGHTRIGGYFTTVEVCGVSALRVTVPRAGDCPAFERIYSREALFCFTPTSELFARAVVEEERHRPVHLCPTRDYLALTEGAQDEDDARYEAYEDEDVSGPHNAGPF